MNLFDKLNKNIKAVITVLLPAIALCFPLQISAVRAYPYPVEVKQPNGEVITIQAHGDEFAHYVTTADGYVVAVDSEGYFTFAEINDEGHILPGKIRVSENTLKSDNHSFLKANSPEFIQKFKNAASKRINLTQKSKKSLQSIQRGETLRSLQNTAAGNTKELVILAEFTDQSFSVQNPRQAFTDMLNQSAYSPAGAYGFTGSVRDYFISSSDGQYKPEFCVYGPVKLLRDRVFYGANDAHGNDKNPGLMILEACKEAKKMYGDELKFADFPKNGWGDDACDNVSVIYAGHNEAENSDLTYLIWPHSYFLDGSFSKQERTVDGVAINHYICTSELRGQPPRTNMAGIGTYTHEYGHALGLPDFYDVNGSQDGLILTEPEDWSIMSSGNYLNNGNTPPSCSAVERWWLGWLDLYSIPYVNEGNLKIPPIISSDTKKAYILNTPTEHEAFIFEVRKIESWDSFLKGEGMLIYHVDMNDRITYRTEMFAGSYSMSVFWEHLVPNFIGDHPGLKLVTANGEIMTPEPKGRYAYYTDYAGHPFPGANGVTSISDDTHPGFLSWNNERSGISIYNIKRHADGSVSFTHSDVPSGIRENHTNAPFAFGNSNVIYFENISGNTVANIYDVKGNLYLSKKICEPDNQKITVPGIYIVKLQTSNDVFTCKVIVR